MAKEWNDEKNLPAIVIRQRPCNQGEQDYWKALENSALSLNMGYS